MPDWAGLILGQTSHCREQNSLSKSGGVVGFEIDWYIYSVIGTKQALNDNSQALNEKTDKSETRCIKSSQNHIIIT